MSDEIAAERNRVVRFHYRLSDESGVEIETSRGGEAALALLGHGNLLPGLEAALIGRRAGEQLSVQLAPDEAFGARRDDWTQRVSKKHFPRGARFQPGSRVPLQTADRGVRTVTVIKVGSKFVDVDLNHPLAGQSVTFDVDLLEVREATAEEKAHGHAHGAGGHRH